MPIPLYRNLRFRKEKLIFTHRANLGITKLDQNKSKWIKKVLKIPLVDILPINIIDTQTLLTHTRVLFFTSWSKM